MLQNSDKSGADPEFPVGGWTRFGGRGPPMWALFGENVCEDERIGSRGGGACAGIFLCRSANVNITIADTSINGTMQIIRSIVQLSVI